VDDEFQFAADERRVGDRHVAITGGHGPADRLTVLRDLGLAIDQQGRRPPVPFPGRIGGPVLVD
jgi:hypothetical protein